ncbi:uncharacterized protein BKA55DRAFT_578621 [Fusarium redolens]|uniref:Uncharacterized protein n=1 Tax=Fusarium redolens TaxID=48865 RepID=A0A9P9GC59_FUSRE|nr:uncharacterized protein BKA55DRAFT_578621 [Fusarium redolens]KAH7236839.1 hypothetical protein BKA55DRAFT_578621 [Fusarium redolens]
MAFNNHKIKASASQKTGLTMLHPAARNGLVMRSMEMSAGKDSHKSSEAEELKGFRRRITLEVAGCDDVLGPWR